MDLEKVYCPSCGGPIVLGPGDQILVVTHITIQDEEIIEEETQADWCPRCRREWEERFEGGEG